MAYRFSSIAVLGRNGDRRISPALTRLVPVIQTSGATALVDQALAAMLEDPTGVQFHAPERLCELADLAVVIGGDGTLLKAAKVFNSRSIPLVGINLGRLGFLTDISPATLNEDMSAILRGEGQAEQRLMLDAEAVCNQQALPCPSALNDIVIQKTDGGRMIEFETHVDGRLVCAHRADGIVIATPTGSTAYALSGGGSIMQAALEVMTLVPICPHTLGDRPIVIGGGSQVEILVVNTPGGHAQVTSDGQPAQLLQAGDRVRVRRATSRATFIHPPGYDYYHVLRSKLHWGPVRLEDYKG